MGNIIIEVLAPIDAVDPEYRIAKLARRGVSVLKAVDQYILENGTGLSVQMVQTLLEELPPEYGFETREALANYIQGWRDCGGEVVTSVGVINNIIKEGGAGLQEGHGIATMPVGNLCVAIAISTIPNQEGCLEGKAEHFRILKCMGILNLWKFYTK